jgi:anaerobic magnesium-protoporphyrin IX monomethyl ester cyclase
MKITLTNCGVRTSKDFDGARAPQGCLYLLAAAEESGFDVGFRDYQLEKVDDPLNPATFAAYLDDDSDVVAISCMSNLLPLVLLATRILKGQYPAKTILLGGIGPSGVAEHIMNTFSHVDIIASGEGEETFVELLEAFNGQRQLENVHGILLRDDMGNALATPPRRRRHQLDDLPRPAYHRVDMARYETVGIQTARGCPFPCTFCDVSVYWGRSTTYRSIAPVMDEMLVLERFGFERVTILDDTFILKKDRVKDFCHAWVDRGLKIEWSAYCRVDLLDDPMMDLLGESGCYRVFLGIESGSNDVLSRISKPLKQDHLVRAVKRMSKRMVVRCNLIWGFPFETMNDLRQTVEMLFYLQDLGCDVSLSLLSPLPLSSLYEKREYPLVLREDLQSSVVSSRFYAADNTGLRDAKPAQLVELIRRYPEIFPGFYTFKDDLFEDKLSFLYSRGLEIEKLERQ